ncbi:MAG: response regulator transcription factor [Granulosicoccus sp.]
MNPVLLIDDDGKLAEVLSEYCAKFGIRIEPALLPSIGLEKLHKDSYDAVILDVMLPEMDGFEVCKKIRQFTDIPIVMLTARGEVTDRIVGLELGADDYLPKPFDPRELVARLQVNIKRHKQGSSSTSNTDEKELFFEGLCIHTLTREVQVEQNTVELTTMEYSLLLMLSQSPGKAFTRDQILATLKGTETELFSRSVDILVSRLRSKLKPLQAIRTIHGAGYAFVLQPLANT